MIRYGYTTYSTLPAPFAHVALRCPQTGNTSQETAAQIDTGSDFTVLPGKLVDELQLQSMGITQVAGLGGHISRVGVYRVDVTIRSLPTVRIKAVRNDNELFVLLGRDVLNHFRLVLDGPASSLEIG